MSGPQLPDDTLKRWATSDNDMLSAAATIALTQRATIRRLAEELRIIADANPSKWDEDVRDQFRKWAQNRAHAALLETDIP